MLKNDTQKNSTSRIGLYGSAPPPGLFPTDWPDFGLMFFYDCKILNPKLAPNWFTNVKVIEIMPNLGVNGTGPLQVSSLMFD